MAFLQLGSIPLCHFTRLSPHKLVALRAPTHATASVSVRIASTTSSDRAVVRRSGNYPRTIWDYDRLQSLTSVYVGEPYTRQAEKLKDNVRMMLDKALEPLDQLELIDDLQRLGLYYHFEDEIETILKSIYVNRNNDVKWRKEDLSAKALEFQLLRQHGFHVPQEIFISFMDETGNFKASLYKDIKGLLCLYEASYLSIEGENIMEKARDFTTRHLVESLKQNIDHYLAIQVSHALEVPFHWRMPRLEVRWFIDAYERKQDLNPILLELAKLDFNMVQAIHQEDLKYVSRWWRQSNLVKKLSFARDRIMECFLWTVGMTMEPQYGHCRRMLAKVNALITLIDDIYDVYGTLEELELFTDAVERWEINAMEHLPDYTKMCFLALYDLINEMGYDILKEQDSYMIPYLKKTWAELCKSYFLEAKWYYTGYTPTLEEYLDNARISIAASLMIGHIYVLTTKPIMREALECLEGGSNVIHGSAMLLRLADDLGTSPDEIRRGDVPKSIQCYMHETGASEEGAREYIRKLIDKTWQQINEDRFGDSPFPKTIIRVAMNLGRMAQCMYQHGDGHGVDPEGAETKDRVSSLFLEPFPL